MYKRRVLESPIERGITEEYPYKFTLTDKVPTGTYANAFNIIYNHLGVDVTSTVMTGSPSVSSTLFTTASFVASTMTAGKRYRLFFGFDIDGKQWDWNLYIDAKI